MSLYKYFSKEKQPLPNPNGPLKDIIMPSTIVAINKEVESQLETPPLSKKRGHYASYTPSQKAMIGKRAAEEGVTAAMRYFKSKYPDFDLKETTVRRFKNVYVNELKVKKSSGTDEIRIKEIENKKRGRPTLLLCEMEDQLRAYLIALRDNGGVVNSAITIASARGLVIKSDANLLCENGGHISLTKPWAQSFLARMGFVKRRGTTKAQVAVADFESLRLQFIHDVKGVVEMDEISPHLIVNWDQTGINYVPISEWTMEKCGTKRVAITGISDKRQITAVFGASATGDFLPPQLVYTGKTKKCLPPVTFPEDWDVTYSNNHWSNEETMKSYLMKIIIPYLEKKREDLKVSPTHPCLVLFDNFKAQCTDSILSILIANNIHYVFIPPNCTDRLQPLDLSVNKAAKNFLRNCFQGWYSEQMRLQFDSGEEIRLVNLGMPIVKPLGAHWMIELYHHFKSHPEIVINGFKAAGIYH